MARARVSITGDKKIDRAFARLAKKDQRRLLDDAIEAAADLITAEMKSTAPVWTGVKSAGRAGDLRKGIRTKKGRSRSSSRVSYSAGSYAQHAYLVSFGNTKTRPRRWKSGKSTGHMPPNPFVQRAFVRRGRAASMLASKLIRSRVIRELVR